MSRQLRLGEILRDEGIERVYLNNREWVSWARHIAWLICHQYGEVTINDIREWADAKGKFPSHPNAWGAVFRSKEWVHTGEWLPVRHAAGHARAVRVWTLRNVGP